MVRNTTIVVIAASKQIYKRNTKEPLLWAALIIKSTVET